MCRSALLRGMPVLCTCVGARVVCKVWCLFVPFCGSLWSWIEGAMLSTCTYIPHPGRIVHVACTIPDEWKQVCVRVCVCVCAKMPRFESQRCLHMVWELLGRLVIMKLKGPVGVKIVWNWVVLFWSAALHRWGPTAQNIHLDVCSLPNWVSETCHRYYNGGRSGMKERMYVSICA